MRTTRIILIGLTFASPARAGVPDAKEVSTAIEKGLKRIEAGITSYPKHRQCFSCHHQAMAAFSLTAAREKGFAIDADLLKRQVPFSLRTFRNKEAIAQGRGVGGDSTGVVYVLHMLASVKYPADATTDALVKYLVVKQRKDGAWPIAPFGQRPPTMGSLFTNTGLAMFALKHYAQPRDREDSKDLQQSTDTAIAKGRDWLLANKPESTEDKVFHLHGLVDAGVDTKVIEDAKTRLLEEQRSDGSWAQLSKMSGDAYATATVLVALRKAGLNVKHAAYQKGIAYLINTQTEDGAWIVETRSRPLQRFFDNGDPGGKSQFISFAATNWAVLALLETVPPVPSDKP